GAGSIGKLEEQRKRGVEVEQIVVGELLALENLRLGEGDARWPGGFSVEAGELVRIFAVAQRLRLLVGQRQRVGKQLAGLGEQIDGEGGVLRWGVREGFAAKRARSPLRTGSGAEL